MRGCRRPTKLRKNGMFIGGENTDWRTVVVYPIVDEFVNRMPAVAAGDFTYPLLGAVTYGLPGFEAVFTERGEGG